MEKLTQCKVCGAKMATNAKACPACGAKNKKPFFKKPWFWILVVVIILAMAGAAGGDDEETSENNETLSDNTVIAGNTIFEGDCGITGSATMGKSSINFPELSISITNTSDKNIAAIQFWAVPLNVYGEELDNWNSQKELYTDEMIPTGESTKVSFQLIDEEVKTVKLYVYSVYYEDGTEWGDRNADEKDIIAGAPVIEVK